MSQLVAGRVASAVTHNSAAKVPSQLPLGNKLKVRNIIMTSERDNLDCAKKKQ